MKERLENQGKRVSIIDGDVVRETLHTTLGFSREDIRKNNQLIAEMAKEKSAEFDVILVPIISPYTEDRQMARSIIGTEFTELFINTPLVECIRRDPKGLYKKALRGEIENYIGLSESNPYQMPLNPDLKIDTLSNKEEDNVQQILTHIMQYQSTVIPSGKPVSKKHNEKSGGRHSDNPTPVNNKTIGKIRSRILTAALVQKSYHYAVSKIADAYIISFPKSGRTWIRMLLAQTISLKKGTKLNLDLYKTTLGDKSLPNIATDPRTAISKKLRPRSLEIERKFRNKKIIFLARDPRDVMASFYFEWTRRRNFRYQKGISSFIREESTLKQAIGFMNLWTAEMQKRKDDFVFITYEDLHNDPSRELRKVVDFLGISISDEIIDKAVENSSFKNMLAMEKGNRFKGDHRLQAVDPNDRQSYKMRRGIVGGYKEHFSQEDISYMDQKLQLLNPLLPYGNPKMKIQDD